MSVDIECHRRQNPLERRLALTLFWEKPWNTLIRIRSSLHIKRLKARLIVQAYTTVEHTVNLSPLDVCLSCSSGYTLRCKGHQQQVQLPRVSQNGTDLASQICTALIYASPLGRRPPSGGHAAGVFGRLRHGLHQRWWIDRDCLVACSESFLTFMQLCGRRRVSKYLRNTTWRFTAVNQSRCKIDDLSRNADAPPAELQAVK